MSDLTPLYNAFDIDEPLPADDTARYVDLSSARGDQKVALKLRQRIRNAQTTTSHHLLMGHTKCGKTTELNRTIRLLEEDNYATVFFDIAETGTRTIEYTTLLLRLAGHTVAQLARRPQRPVEVNATPRENLLKLLQDREITIGGTYSGELKASATGKTGWLANWVGKLGLGFELTGGYERSREITTKLEADVDLFLAAIKDIIHDAREGVLRQGYKGLVVICDGCDKLLVTASDKHGHTYDLQKSMFVDHASDLRSIPCHVIYTVPISIPVHLGDIWEQSPEFIPAIPVNIIPGIAPSYSEIGRTLLRDVVERRLRQYDSNVIQLFARDSLLDQLISVSGGHISDLLLLVRDAILEAQTDDDTTLSEFHVNRSILTRSLEYTRLLESRYLPVLVTIDQLKLPSFNNDDYRQLIFNRLALEYVCGERICVDLHPLIAASDAYQRWRTSQSP